MALVHNARRSVGPESIHLSGRWPSRSARRKMRRTEEALRAAGWNGRMVFCRSRRMFRGTSSWFRRYRLNDMGVERHKFGSGITPWRTTRTRCFTRWLLHRSTGPPLRPSITAVPNHPNPRSQKNCGTQIIFSNDFKTVHRSKRANA